MDARQQKSRDVATLADLKQACGETVWLWLGWLVLNAVTLVAAPGGTGKTRVVFDLLRRIAHRLPWPDGSPAGPALTEGRALALLVVSDNHHDELCSLVEEFRLPEDRVYLNATPAEPFGGTTLECRAEWDALEARALAVKPLFIIVDTVGGATDLNLSRQEEARAFYAPLQALARKAGCAVLCLTHVNAVGGVLGRRAVEKARVVIQLCRPEEHGPVRMEVTKTNARPPEPLGLSLRTGGCDYSSDPPPLTREPNAWKRKPANPGVPRVSTLDTCKAWLRGALAAGPVPVQDLRAYGEDQPWSPGTLYNAGRALGVETLQLAGRQAWTLPKE